MTDGDINDSDLFIAVSTGITDPTLKSNAPAGDVAYFLVSKLNYKFISGNKINRYGGRSSRSDKRGVAFNIIIVKEGWLLNKDINQLVEKILNGGHTAAHAMLYCFVKLNSPGGTYDAAAVYLSFMDRDENTVWHLKGQFSVADIDIEGTNLYKLKFTFLESLNL